MDNNILNLPGFAIVSVRSSNPAIIEAKYKYPSQCPHCSSYDLRTKDSFVRNIRHESLGNRKTLLIIKSHKYRCNNCGRYFNQRFPGILKYKRSTEAFRREIFEKHNNGICQSKLSELASIGPATVERWYHDYLKVSVSRWKNDPCPMVMGIDEHFFSRKKGYATTICDLKNHRVFDVTLGRTEVSLASYFNNLGLIFSLPQ